MENTKFIDNMSEVLCDELKKIAKKGDSITPQELDSAYKAMKTVYYGQVIKAMQEAEEEREKGMQGYSQNRGYSYGTMRMPYFHTYEDSMNMGSREGGRSYADSNNSYRDGGSYDGGRSYAESYEMSRARAGRDGDGDGRYSETGSYDNSYRRGRDAMGRYTSREGGYSGHEEKEQMRKQIEQMRQKIDQM